MPHAQEIAQRRIDQKNTMRLVSTAWSQETVLSTLALPEDTLSELAELDGSTNERLEAEQGHRQGISIHELVFGIPEAIIVNAAFSHPQVEGGRFHSPDRGAWYAGFDEPTAVAEVRFHRLRSLRDTRATGSFELPHRAFLSDFAGEFHHLTSEDRNCLAPGPVPACYSHPQAVARALLDAGSAGIVYPSVRHAQGWVIACFRPAMVFNVRRAELVVVHVSL